MLGLDEEQAVHAISHTWVDGAPLRTYSEALNAGPRKGWAGGRCLVSVVSVSKSDYLLHAGIYIESVWLTV